jgi:hypothetical protein
MLGRFVSERLVPIADERDRELAGLKSTEAWHKRQQATRARLEDFFGRFGPKCPLNARIAGTIDRPDYVIEKLIFESQPGYYVTANVYVPKGRAFPLPGVLFTCGHAAHGKAYHLYHECCLGLVLKGYLVLGLDPMGQGERSEYFDPDTGEPRVPLTVSQHHYLGRPSWLVGRSLAGYRTWDCIRALAYKLIVGSQYYQSRDYFWINGALKDFDLPDLIGLVAPRRAVLMNPVDAMLEPLDNQECGRLCDWPRGVYERLGAPEQFFIAEAAADTARQVDEALGGL